MRASASTSSTPAHAHDRQHQPGKPGAAAEIDQAVRAGAGHSGRSCAESRKCRRHGSASVLRRDQVDARATSRPAARHRPRAAPVFHVKHRSASAKSSGVVGSSGAGFRAALYILQQRDQRRRGHAGDARRGAQRRRPRRRELAADLGRQAADRGVIERPPAAAAPRRGGRRRCRAPGVRDSRHSARRFRAARRCPARCAPSSGQTAASRARSMPGCASSSAALRGDAVVVDREAVAAQRGRAHAQFASRARAPRRAPSILAAKARARSPPTAPSAQPDRGQPLVGIVGPQGQPVFGARGEHPVGLAGAAGHQIVDQHADIGVGAVERRAAAAPAADSAALSPAIRPCAAASS